jgi:hypothetical protein
LDARERHVGERGAELARPPQQGGVEEAGETEALPLVQLVDERAVGRRARAHGHLGEPHGAGERDGDLRLALRRRVTFTTCGA